MTESPATPPARMSPARTKEEYERTVRLPFDPRGMECMRVPLQASDVVIATFPKAGTTWTQQICHGLRSRGDMNFKEISHVVPWIERGHMFAIDAWKPQAFAPRTFKTHLEHANVNKGARYIHVVREPKDTLVSFYRFMSNGVIDPSALSIDDFADAWLFSDQLAERQSDDEPFGPNLYNYWRHLLDWWGAREHAPVLTLAYENMQRDLPGHVARIAAFMGIPADAETLEIATRQSTFAFMSAHEDQFADNIPGTEMRFSKVVDGKVGSYKARVSPELAARIDAKWQEYVTPVLGVRSYEEFISKLAL